MAGRLLDVSGALEYLGCYSEKQLRSLVYRRQIPHVKIGRALRFDTKALDRWIRDHTVDVAS